jgi:hypothetical protein
MPLCDHIATHEQTEKHTRHRHIHNTQAQAQTQILLLPLLLYLCFLSFCPTVCPLFSLNCVPPSLITLK